jgi:hypothetical protein
LWPNEKITRSKTLMSGNMKFFHLNQKLLWQNGKEITINHSLESGKPHVKERGKKDKKAIKSIIICN